RRPTPARPPSSTPPPLGGLWTAPHHQRPGRLPSRSGAPPTPGGVEHAPRRGRAVRSYTAIPGYRGNRSRGSVARRLAWSPTDGSRLYLALESGTGWVASRTAWTMAAISRISSAPMPRVVTAGVPRRRPLVYQLPLGSKGMTLRLRVTPASRRAVSAWRPVRPEGRGAHRTTLCACAAALT